MAKTQALRPYQQAARDAIHTEWENGHARTLLVLPTGTGKTIVFASVAADQVRAGDRVLILAHRGELLEQAADKLQRSTGLVSAVEKAESTCLDSWFRVVVGSVQTLQRTARLERFPQDYFGTIIIDEAHHAITDGYRRILDYFSGAKVLGVTATPDRGDMRNLGEVFWANDEGNKLYNIDIDGVTHVFSGKHPARPNFVVRIGDMNYAKKHSTLGDTHHISVKNVYSHGTYAVGLFKGLVDAELNNIVVADGGEVYFPKGTYISGTLYLKSGGGLNLSSGAVLRASHDRADYNADDFCEQNVAFSQETVTGAHLIVAVEQENIFIKGEGIIDGDSHYWMNESRMVPGEDAFAPHPDRIAQIIFFANAKT